MDVQYNEISVELFSYSAVKKEVGYCECTRDLSLFSLTPIFEDNWHEKRIVRVPQGSRTDKVSLELMC